MANQEMQRRIRVARGQEPADVVLKGAKSLDVFSGRWLEGDVAIAGSMIAGVGENYQGNSVLDCTGCWLVPGFIDSHVHIESTMMLPSEYARATLPRGTTAAIWDPHEIANVFGIDGLQWALRCAEMAPQDLFVMLSSCVPSSAFESAGAEINAAQLSSLKNHPRALGLAEMMNFPAVLAGDDAVLDKLGAFADRPKDGHSPMLRGKDLNAYIGAGIRSCHEVCSRDEAEEKLSRGMRVMVREGSVAKNASELAPIMTDFSGIACLICTDDRNPLDIAKGGHIDEILRIIMGRGIRPEVAFRSASFSTALHYGLHDRGALAPGYLADIVVLKDIASVRVQEVIKSGQRVSSSEWKWPVSPQPPKENSIFSKANEDCLDVRVPEKFGAVASVEVEVIEVVPDQIFTKAARAKLPVQHRRVMASGEIQKIAVFERHRGTGNVGVGFVRGFSLREGAIASSVAHDAHNLGIVGVDDASIWTAFSALCRLGGGIVVVNGRGKVLAELSLPIAGLMSRESFSQLVPKIERLREAVKGLGCSLTEPFLQLSFLALPVIPAFKITDRGLIDVDRQKIVPVIVGA